jgi:hypothetical protein
MFGVWWRAPRAAGATTGLAGDTHLVVVQNDKTFRYCPTAAAEVLARAAPRRLAG